MRPRPLLRRERALPVGRRERGRAAAAQPVRGPAARPRARARAAPRALRRRRRRAVQPDWVSWTDYNCVNPHIITGTLTYLDVF